MSTPAKTPTKVAAKEDPSEALRKLENKTKAVNANNVARVANSQLIAATEPLQPLLSLKTGRAIDRFPKTSQDIAKLSLTLVDSMLLALEAERTGKESEKRERLRVQIGLRPNPA